MHFPRASGILLHVTSLPGRFGIGDLGDEAYRFIDFLAETGQTYWQILPLVPTGYGDSPYSSVSAFAGNTLLISPKKLADDGLISAEFLENGPEFPTTRVDYGMVYEWKRWMLEQAFENFRGGANAVMKDEFDTFCLENHWWLDDYTLFRAVKGSRGHKPWFEWDEPLKIRDDAALNAVRSQLEQPIEAEKFNQFLFFRQWLLLKDHANGRGIKIIGDVPIFVAHDSVDVWCNQDKFKLNGDGSARVVSGVPPDCFSATGQLWGNPIYDWNAMRDDNFGWWTARLAFTLRMVDVVRLDHFIGFARMWEVPGGDKTAEHGAWAEVPGGELFAALNNSLGVLPIIAEDLGAVTPEVENLRDSHQLPGMRVLQFGFGGDPRDMHLPHNYVRNCVAYTGTHDNDTSAGWYKSAPKKQRQFCKKYLRSNGREIHWDMIRACLASVADTAILPMQDILGLGNEARMNLPAGAAPNWQWRLPETALDDAIVDRLREFTETFGRSNTPAF